MAALGRRCDDWGDVGTAVPEATAVGDGGCGTCRDQATCAQIAALVAGPLSEGFVPVVLGGDHSVALGPSAAWPAPRAGRRALVGRARRPEHARDSASGNVHGMPLAAALGLAGPAFETTSTLPAVEARRVAWSASARSSPASNAAVGVEARVFTMSDLDRLGVEAAMAEALEHVAGTASSTSASTSTCSTPSRPRCRHARPGRADVPRGALAMELIAESALVARSTSSR